MKLLRSLFHPPYQAKLIEIREHTGKAEEELAAMIASLPGEDQWFVRDCIEQRATNTEYKCTHTRNSRPNESAG